MTKSKFWTAALCLAITTLVEGQGLWAAEPENAQWEELKAQMKTEGWTPIAEGVFERQRGATKVEHMAYGPKGLAWHVGELNRRLERLAKEYENYPSQELGDNIDNLKVKIASLRRELRSLPEGTASLSEAVTGGSCSNICYSATVDAYGLTSSQGTGAIADAKFNSACGYVGTAFTHAYARATTAGGTQTVKIVDDPVSGTGVAATSVTRHAEATAPGMYDCYSEAYASVDSTALGIAYSTSEENYSCPAIPPTVVINGPTSISVSGTACQTANWTSTVTGGTTPYTYAWTRNGVAAGSGSSLAVQYCGNNTAYTSTDNLVLTVNGGSDTHTTTITYTQQPSAVTINGPTSMAISGTECQTATYTSAVTGGTAPYTYAWTRNGAAAGSGSSLSVQHCGNNTSSSNTENVGVTVNGVVSDTHTTTITYTAPQPTTCTATIDGPTSISIWNTQCQTLTWTSTVSCGSLVTYAWSINGAAAGTSTSTSVSKTYCGNNTNRTVTVNLSLTVTGSGSATDTHATTINYNWDGCYSNGFCP